MEKAWQRLALSALLVIVSVIEAPVYAGEVLELVKSRGELRCGVSEGTPGFSSQDAAGNWHGLDVDFCRAVAAATLQDPRKVRFIPLRASMRFPALLSGQVDLLARNTTWTLAREALLKVRFPAVLFYDSQGFLVHQSAKAVSMADLHGATICVEKGTTHALRLTDVFAARGLTVTPLIADSVADAQTAFFANRCKAYSADVSHLAGIRLQAPMPGEYILLPDRVSKEPLGPVVRHGDAEWETLVRWVLLLLIAAEEHGVTAANVEEVAGSSIGSGWRMLAMQDTRVSRALGVPDDWALQALQSAGNYGEMFDRNVGLGSPLRLERGYNRLWNAGGLMYAPPME